MGVDVAVHHTRRFSHRRGNAGTHHSTEHRGGHSEHCCESLHSTLLARPADPNPTPPGPHRNASLSSSAPRSGAFQRRRRLASSGRRPWLCPAVAATRHRPQSPPRFHSLGAEIEREPRRSTPIPREQNPPTCRGFASMEQAGLEPAISWVRCHSSAVPLQAKGAVNRLFEVVSSAVWRPDCSR
jgi:hypothetical protein